MNGAGARPMFESILECSGGHWVRAALTWICITVAIAVNLPESKADEQAEHASHAAKAEATVASAVKASWEQPAAVTHRVTPFDFNAAAMTAYGDTELVEPAFSRER
jgi:hypothetical protein